MMTALRPETEKRGYIIRTSAEEGATEVEFRDDMAYLRAPLGGDRREGEEPSARASLPGSVARAAGAPRHGAPTDRPRRGRLRQVLTPSGPLPSGSCRASRKAFALRGAKRRFRTSRRGGRVGRRLGRRVDLKSGGYLVFDQTEAMTTIDVNTGATSGSATSATRSSRRIWRPRRRLPGN